MSSLKEMYNTPNFTLGMSKINRRHNSKELSI